MKKPESEWEVITPACAAEYLLLNPHNRPISPTKVTEWAKEMANEQWVVTHQGIGFDVDGNLVDGQHRLAAIVESGKSIKMLVTTNLPTEAFAVVDDGKARTAADLFTVRHKQKHGGQAPTEVHRASSIACAALSGIANAQPHKEKVSDYALKHVNLIGEVMPAAKGNGGSCVIAGAFLNAALYFGRERVLPLVTRYATEMWTGVNDPFKHLHRRVVQAKLSEKKRDGLSKPEKYALTVAAIRLALQGKDAQKLQVTTQEIGKAPEDKKVKQQGAA